jgi:hypothetical protein
MHFVFFAAGLRPTTHMRNDSGSDRFYLISYKKPTTHMRIAWKSEAEDLISCEKNKMPSQWNSNFPPKVSSGINSTYYV